MKKKISILMVWIMVLTLVGVASPTQGSNAIGKIRLSKTNLTLMVGASKKLVLKNAKGTVKWNSLKKSVASVDKKGIVKAKKPGNSVVVATNAGKSYMCSVTVKPKKKPHPQETAEPIETTEPTLEPIVTPTPAPIATPTSTPIATPVPTPIATPVPTPIATLTPVATPTPTPTPTPSTPKEYRESLKAYIISHTSKDSKGVYTIKKSAGSSGKVSQTVMIEYNSTDNKLTLGDVSNTKLDSGARMNAVNDVTFDVDGNAKLVWTDFFYDSSDKLSHMGMLTYESDLSQIGGDRTYPWNISLNTGSGAGSFSESDLYEMADTHTKLMLTTLDTYLKYQMTGFSASLEKLGFGS